MANTRSNGKGKMSMEAFAASSYLSDGNAGYLESLYEQYLASPDTTEALQSYFNTMWDGQKPQDISQQAVRARALAWATQPARIVASSGAVQPLQWAVDRLIAAYRRLGHLKARLDPLADPRPAVPALTLLRYGLEGQLQQVFQTRGVLSVQ